VCSGAYLNAQALYNKGALYVGGVATDATTSLYVKGNLRVVGSDGSIAHKGKTVLTGDLINDVTKDYVFKSTQKEGIFEFGGSSPQRIRGSADKISHYIEFPEQLHINNKASDYRLATVTIVPAMGIAITNMKFEQGRMVLASDTVLDASKTTEIAHLYVNNPGSIAYNHGQADKKMEGLVQVNLSLGKWEDGRLIAFSSPFRKMYADYFLFNFLARPNTTAATKENGVLRNVADEWIKDPKTPLDAGRGFFVGRGFVKPWNNDYYTNTLAPQYSSAIRNDAATDSFVFARLMLPPSLGTFVAGLSEVVTGEELNITNVSLSLDQGFQMIGNPFTTPLDLNELMTGTLNTSDWGAAAANLTAGYYKLTGGKGERLPSGRFRFTSSFTYMSSGGSTGDQVDSIAPMQAFLVHKHSGGTQEEFIIPASKRVHKRTPFLRSAPEPPTDELLIETRDLLTGGFDRLCVVFRKNASHTASDVFDAPKLFNRTGGVNQIYTRSSDSKDLVNNIMPSSTEKLLMYFEPAAEAQEVKLTADRLSTITSVPNVVLEDRQTGKVVDLKKSPTYHFLSSPEDKTDRFMLYFGSGAPVGTEGLSSPLFYASYTSGALWVHGIKETWLGGGGSSVVVYDMLGRLIHRQIITEAPSLHIAKHLSKGVYVVKVTTENASIAKFVVK
jgi:hypothetical protein